MTTWCLAYSLFHKESWVQFTMTTPPNHDVEVTPPTATGRNEIKRATAKVKAHKIPI